MAKDPAFLFYYQDFAYGTRRMTFEEKGAYIELLCEQADSGHLLLSDIKRILNSHYHIWDSICSKFIKDGDGKYFNKVLDEHLDKRKKYTESRKNNLKGSHMDKHMGKHMENVNENRNVIKKEDKYYLDEFEKFNFKSKLYLQDWQDWIDYRIETKKKVSLRSAKMQLKFLSEQPNPAKCIDQSIKNQWQGLFEEKNNGTNKEQTPRGTIDFEKYARELATIKPPKS